MTLDAKALAIAAKVSGLREDQVDAAVGAYREAIAKLYDEPEWRVVTHFMGVCICHGEGTKVQMETHSATKHASATTFYSYRDKIYETFGEARAVELGEQEKFKIRALNSNGGVKKETGNGA